LRRKFWKLFPAKAFGAPHLPALEGPFGPIVFPGAAAPRYSLASLAPAAMNFPTNVVGRRYTGESLGASDMVVGVPMMLDRRNFMIVALNLR
jgi:hypothetical protein